MTATLDRIPSGQLPAGVPLPEQLLTRMPVNRPMALAHEIAALREALACVTAGASSDMVHGRIDSMIAERTTELLGHYAQVVSEGYAQLGGGN